MMEITNVSEYEKLAKERLPKMIYDYYASGAEDQWTLEVNRNAFSRILFQPRILIDVRQIDITTTILGFKVSMPIMIAPTAMQKMAHREGWLQKITKLPILLKGVLTADDAKLAIQAGAAGIILSNHGARQLDYVPATIMALEEIVNVVRCQISVFLDGGIRRGTDVFKALALGASGVFIGRPIVFSLAVGGEAGVQNMLKMLRDEFELTMALSGCRAIKEITRDHVLTEQETRPGISKVIR